MSMDTHSFSITADHAGTRIDKALGQLDETLSRSRIQALMAAGHVQLNGSVCKDASRKLSEGDDITIDVPEAAPAEPQPENIPLDIVHEDEDLLVINKPAGMVVHPGAGNPSGTLVNALLHHCAGDLSGIGGVMRPGIVHRLDKNTTGLMVIAKNDRAHQHLSAQLEDRSLSRIYQALVLHVPTPVKGRIEQPIGRHPTNRLKMDINSRNGRESVTHYKVLKSYGEACALVECKLETGRTHQIRVHMASIKHPLIGDPLYGPQPTALAGSLRKAGYDEKTIETLDNFPRQALHAGTMGFTHPATEKTKNFTVPLPADMEALLALL